VERRSGEPSGLKNAGDVAVNSPQPMFKAVANNRWRVEEERLSMRRRMVTDISEQSLSPR
jgi:hypothetical protein